MNLKPHIKNTLLIFIRNWKMNIISFILFPMVLSFIYGTMSTKTFKEDKFIEGSYVHVKFNYNKNSIKGELLTKILNNENLNSPIKNDENANDFIAYIDDEFSNVKIISNLNSYIVINIVKTCIKRYLSILEQYSKVYELVESKYIQDKIINKIEEVNSENAFEQKLIINKSIEGREYFAISIYTFTMMFLIQRLARDFYRHKREGIVRRAISIGTTKQQYFLSYIISGALIIFITMLVYMIINRILKIAFLKDSIGFILVACIISILCSSIVGLVIVFIEDEKNSAVIMMLLIMLPATVGQVFIKGDMLGLQLLNILKNISPNTLALNALKTISVTGNFISATKECMLMLIISLLFILISLVKIKRKWEI